MDEENSEGYISREKMNLRPSDEFIAENADKIAPQEPSEVLIGTPPPKPEEKQQEQKPVDLNFGDMMNPVSAEQFANARRASIGNFYPEKQTAGFRDTRDASGTGAGGSGSGFSGVGIGGSSVGGLNNAPNSSGYVNLRGAGEGRFEVSGYDNDIGPAMAGRIVAMIAAGLSILSFCLPWFSLLGQDIVPIKLISQAAGSTEGLGSLIGSVLPMVLEISIIFVLCVISIMTRRRSVAIASATYDVTMSGYTLISVITIMMRFSEYAQYGISITSIIGPGIWMLLIANVALVISSMMTFMRYKK